MSEDDPKAASGAVPPIKRRVIKSAQTAPEGGATAEVAAPAAASSEAAPAPAPKAPIPNAAPLPAVRVESRPDGRRLMDARAPRRPQEDTRRRRNDRPQQSPEARAAELGMPRRPDRTRQTFDDRPRPPRGESPADDRDIKKTTPDGWRRQAEARARDEAESKREPRAPEAAKPLEKRPLERKPTAAEPKLESAAPAAAKEPDSNAEIALAGAPPVRFKQAAPKKDKPKTGKEALAQKARDPKHGRKKNRNAATGSARVEAAAKAKAIEAEAEATESDEQADTDAEIEIPKRPSLWQRVVSIFRRGK